jgi:RNA polymerase sigma-70 factor, ECF subfamily
MAACKSTEMSTKTSSVGRIEIDRAARDTELAAATSGDSLARWSALEACRDYLRLVVRRDRWSSARGPTATSDLIQKTIVDAWGSFSRFRGHTPGQFRAWLRAILVNATLNARRRPRTARLASSGAAGALADSRTSPSEAAARAEATKALDAALAGLSERHRTVIHLRIWDRMSFAQIAAKLEVSEDAARMLWGRAIAKLREVMRSGHDLG